MAVAERTKTTVKTKKNEEVRSFYDYSLLFLTIFLTCFGLVIIYSTSSYFAASKNNDAAYYFKRQGLCAVIGIISMLAMSKIDYHILLKKIPILKIRMVTFVYLMAIALQVYVLMFGRNIKGAKRWIDIGPLGTFQPSEVSKIAVFLFTAYIIYQNPKAIHKFSGFLKVSLYISPIFILIAKENLSTAIVIAAIMVGICFVASKKKGYFIAVAIILFCVGVVFILLEGYRMDRIDIWRNVETHKDGFQPLQGLYAIASGGLFGTGLGESMQKLGFIPEAHNDMVFTILCEELGLFGAFAIMLLFLLLIWRIFIVAISAPDLYGGLISVGVLIHIAVQVILNIAVVTNSIPSTGIPLPFISYGGTSVAVLLFEMGIVLSVSNQIKIGH